MGNSSKNLSQRPVSKPSCECCFSTVKLESQSTHGSQKEMKTDHSFGGLYMARNIAVIFFFSFLLLFIYHSETSLSQQGKSPMLLFQFSTRCCIITINSVLLGPPDHSFVEIILTPCLFLRCVAESYCC